MPDQDSQTKVLSLRNRGIVTKLDPALLEDGQLFSATNIYSNQEGAITSRPGKKKLGTMGGTGLPFKLAKLSIPSQYVPILNATNTNPIAITTEVPHGWLTDFAVSISGVKGNLGANVSYSRITVTGASSFTIQAAGTGAYVNGGVAVLTASLTGAPDPSIRYVGDGENIYRTLDFYQTFTLVTAAGGVMGGEWTYGKRWSMASYSAGATGNPFAYFACPGKMLKDQGNAPYADLRMWGITPALAAASAINAAVAATVISNATASGLLINITDVAHGYTTGQTVLITDVLGTTEANGTWVVTVTGANNYTLNNSVFTNAYISGGSAHIAGPDSTQPGAGLYDYVYTYRNPLTNNEGNPSPFMDSSLAVSSQNGSITVTIYGSPDPQIANPQSIVLYRRGGAFSDGIFRQIGYSTNPGVDGTGAPAAGTFVDTTPDTGLVYASQAEFDNFPPVVSTLRYPVNATIASGAPGLSPGWNTLTLSLGVNNILRIGSTIYVGSTSSGGTNNQETCVVAAVPYNSVAANTTCLVYFQLKHSVGEPVIIDSVMGQPCYATVAAFDSVFVAGDPNNPHTLYKSKTGRPEAFPVVDSLGNPGSINVGTPSNGIQNICEFRGQILCMNLNNLYTVDVFQGVMYGPHETPAARGLISPWAWCKSKNAVYYVAYDGIWAWDGSQSRKITEQIDNLFHLQSTDIFFTSAPPVTLARGAAAYCRLEFYRDQLFFLYMSTSAPFMNVLRYDIPYDRWIPEEHEPGRSFPNHPVAELMLEEDLGYLIFAREQPGGGIISQYDVPGLWGYTDEYTDNFGLNGAPMYCQFQTGFLTPGGFPQVQLFQDALVEVQNTQAVSVKLYYNYSQAADPVDQFTVAINTARSRIPLPLQVSGNPPLPAGKEATSVSMEASWVPSGLVTGLTTFYSFGIRFIDRDAIQSGMPSDWMNLGSYNDKRLYQLHLEHNTGGQLVNFHMDIRYGVNGTSQQNDVAIFPLQSSEKTTVTLPIPQTSFPGGLTICKAVRLRAAYSNATASPQTSPGNIFRIFYKPTFDAEGLPPDVALFTPLKDFGWACGKIARTLLLDIDTGGVAASITAVADNVNVQTFTATTTANDRKRNIAFASVPAPIGKLWRLLTTPGTNGKSQIFDWSIDYTREPCDIFFWDSWELALGYKGWKLLKQIWFDYLCAVAVELTIIVDGGQTLYTKSLPAQTNRNPQRFYIPDATGTILNKSRTYRLQIESADGVTPFRMYMEASGLEWCPLGADQRQAYQQTALSEATKFISQPLPIFDPLGQAAGVA